MLTSFAGIDISFGEGSPAFFETRVLDGLDELECLDEVDILGRSPRSAPGRDGPVALLGRRRPGCDMAGGRPWVDHVRFSANGGCIARRLDVFGGWFVNSPALPLQCCRRPARHPHVPAARKTGPLRAGVPAVFREPRSKARASPPPPHRARPATGRRRDHGASRSSGAGQHHRVVRVVGHLRYVIEDRSTAPDGGKSEKRSILRPIVSRCQRAAGCLASSGWPGNISQRKTPPPRSL